MGCKGSAPINCDHAARGGDGNREGNSTDTQLQRKTVAGFRVYRSGTSVQRKLIRWRFSAGLARLRIALGAQMPNHRVRIKEYFSSNANRR